jgi:predicted ArsR family transcriptional regulator
MNMGSESKDGKDCGGSGRRRPKMQMLTLEAEIRRSVIRLLNASDKPVSTVELAEELGCDHKTMSYQLGVLAEYRLITQHPGQATAGSMLFFWSSASKSDANVMARLDLEASGDADEVIARRRTRAAA